MTAPNHPARRAPVASPFGDSSRQGSRSSRPIRGRLPTLRIILALLAAPALYGLAEAIHHSGNNPFVSDAVASPSPAPATERAGMGSQP